nr:titin isoform X2 [Drosophila kikkawai]
MSKPKPRQDTTIEEMEELMNQPDADEGQFAAYLQRKLAEKQQPMNNDRLFGNVSFDFDFDVNLVKKPKPQPQPAVSSGDNPDVVAPQESEAPPPVAENNQPTSLPAAPKSPNLSLNRRSIRNVPGSDKLRRRAIRRRSQSCGRQLIKEFEDINVTRNSSSPKTFEPTVSSTPCAGQPPKNIKDKEPEENPQIKKSEMPEAEKTAEKSQVHTEPKKCLTASESLTVDTAAEASLMLRERLSSFQKNIMQLDYTGKAPASDAVGCTYTIEKGPAPGQLLLSPSRRSLSCTATQKRLMPIVKVRREKELLIPDTPPRAHPRGSEPEPEYVVPETQLQDLGELVQNLSRNASGPIVVINTANSKPTTEVAHVQPVSVLASAPALTPLRRTSTMVPSAANNNSSPATVPTSPAKPEESPKSSRKSLLVPSNVDAIMTDDESDEQPSTVAMDLAQRGSDRRQQRCLRNQKNGEPTPDPDKENVVQLLNLHQSINVKKSKRRTRPAKVPLNKAPCAPINGEQFAQELARMTNYEILDLRKRNSLGKVYLVNGHRKSSNDLERSIQLELKRRNLEIKGDRLTGAAELPESEEMLPSLDTKTNRSKRQRSPAKNTSPRQCQEWLDDCESMPPPVPRNFEDSRMRPQRSKRSNYSRIPSDESSDDNIAPQVPCNFQDSTNQTQPALPANRQSRRMSEKLKDETSCIPPPVPNAFKDSRKRPQRSKRSNYSRIPSDESSDDNIAPPVPRNFQDSKNQTEHALPANRQSRHMTRKSEDEPPPPPAPNGFKDRRSSRSNHRSSHESQELSNYMMISKTMEMRRMSRRSVKRKLYTKGDSNAELSDLESPKKQKRYSRSYYHSEVHSEGDNIAIVPPPPHSLRYSQSLRDLRPNNPSDSENVEKGAPLEDFYANTANATIEIAPPPPENIGPNSENPSLRHENNEQDICPPPTEPDKIMEEAIPPPTEYNEPESNETAPAQAPSHVPVNESRLASPTTSIAKASKASQEPEIQCVSSSQDKSISGPEIVTDNEQPSTSLAAQKARERSKKEKTKKDKVNDDAIFKKPLLPAPRAKRKNKELEKLMHSVIYRETSLDDGSISSDGVRRSKRGHVPIKNTWCHTQDIMEMPFMNTKSIIQKPKAKSVAKKKPTAAKEINSKPQSSNRGPVCSSTPRNPDIIVEPFSDSALLLHSAISSKEPEPSAEKHPETQPNFETVMSEGQTNCNNGNSQFRNWLMGTSNVQPSVTNDQGSAASLAEELRFTELGGIDYAFYDTKETAALGYMRFKPHQVRNKKKVKESRLKFIVQIGEFAVQYGAIDNEEEEESCILREGDMIEIDIGFRYSIQNTLDAVGVLLAIRS